MGEELSGVLGRVRSNVINLSSTVGCSVIPVKTGIQSFYAILDPGFRRGDGASDHFILKLMTLECEVLPNALYSGDIFRVTNMHDKAPYG